MVADAFYTVQERCWCKTNPQAPPNFLRAAALGEYKKPVVVMPGSEESYETEEVEPQPESRESQQIPQVQYFDTQIRRQMMFFHLLPNNHSYSPR